MEHEIRVQMKDSSMRVIPSTDMLTNQIHSLVKDHLRMHQLANQWAEDKPLRIIIGPSEESCPCCGRPYDEKKK
jgi:hypothetical protein